MPPCHRELFSTFYLLPSSVFLALQQCSDPPTPSTGPAAQLSGVRVTGSLSLLRGRAVTSPSHFAASLPLQSLQMSQAWVQKPQAPGPGPWVPAKRRRGSAGAHSVISLVH